MLLVRRADVKDAERLMQLWHELVIDHQTKSSFIPISEQWKSFKQKEVMWFLKSPYNVIYVVELFHHVVGYIKGSIRKIPQMYDIKIEGHIEEIYVCPDYRRTGLAKQLVLQIISFFEEKEVDFIDIHVDKENRVGERFWSNMGFETIAVQKRRWLKERDCKG